MGKDKDRDFSHRAVNTPTTQHLPKSIQLPAQNGDSNNGSLIYPAFPCPKPKSPSYPKDPTMQ